MIKAAYFPTIIYAKDVNLDNRLFEKEVIEWSQKDKGVVRTNMKGWHSHTDMHKMPVFKPLVDELFKMQNEIFQEEWLDSEPIIGNMWANLNPPGGYNRPHVHPNSHFSGVLMNQGQQPIWLCQDEKKVNHLHICGEKFV